MDERIEELYVYEKLVKLLSKNAIKSQPREIGINALIFSDSHGKFSKESEVEKLYNEYPDPDMCFLLGDIMFSEVDNILKYYEPTVCVLGNHDQKNLYSQFGLEALNGKIKTIKAKSGVAVNIAAIEGSNRYKPGNDWPLLSQYESLLICEEMLEQKKNIDVILSHDRAFLKSGNASHCVMLGLTGLIFSNTPPVVHIHGHLHKNYIDFYENSCREISVYEAAYHML